MTVPSSSDLQAVCARSTLMLGGRTEWASCKQGKRQAVLDSSSDWAHDRRCTARRDSREPLAQLRRVVQAQQVRAVHEARRVKVRQLKPEWPQRIAAACQHPTNPPCQ